MENLDRSPTTLAAIARAAAGRQNWAAALDAWRRHGATKKGDLESILGQAEAYRGLKDPEAADAILHELAPADAETAEVAISYALNAQTLENWDEALARWRVARATFPHVPATWAAEAAMLQILGQAKQADEITREAISLFPNSIDILAQHCNIAMALGDWIEADKRWTQIEAQYPDHVYTLNTASQIREKIRNGLVNTRGDELEAMAKKADAAEAWSDAAKLWQILYDRAPELSSTIVGFGRALREGKRYDEADRVLGEGVKILPQHDEIRAHYAQVAAARLDWTEAVRRWQEALLLFPEATVFWVMAATAYREAGMLELADQLLAKAIALEPDRVDLHVQHALTAERAGDWTKAVTGWNNAYRLRPDNLVIQNLRGDAIWQENIAKLEGGGRSVKPEPITSKSAEPLDDAEKLKQLVLGFEGLGDNCEFGVLQRRFGADPLGLFRFAAIRTPILTEALRENLRQVGDPSFTELGLTAANEYILRDTRGLYFTHTFILKDSIDPEKLLGQQLSRLGYLKRNLIEDLETGEKIFVHKASLGITNDEILKLYDTITAYGPNFLLEVRKVTDGRSPGSVEIMGERLMVGYVEKLYGGDENNIDSQIDFKSWRMILEVADSHKKRVLRDAPATRL